MSFFIDGAIRQKRISEWIEKQEAKKNYGAHICFIGQVRSDKFEKKKVIAIEYSCYNEMAESVLTNISQRVKKKFNIQSLVIHHSKGYVKVEENSLFVMVSAAHRKNTFAALLWLVEEIKFTVPIWKKEIFDDKSYRWKEEER